MKLKGGYYWVMFPGETSPTIGHYSNKFSQYPWTLVGSDEIYGDKEIEAVICEIQEPSEEALQNI